jgi:hypothetical protein
MELGIFPQSLLRLSLRQVVRQLSDSANERSAHAWVRKDGNRDCFCSEIGQSIGARLHHAGGRREALPILHAQDSSATAV